MTSLYQMFDRSQYPALIRLINQGEFISAEELDAALVANDGEPIPDIILAYLRDMSLGKIKKPLGRKKGGTKQTIRYTMAAIEYERLLPWLRKRKKIFGLKGWESIQRAEWWQGPPHERAARMIARRWFPNHTWRHVLNVVSSYE